MTKSGSKTWGFSVRDFTFPHLTPYGLSCFLLPAFDCKEKGACNQFFFVIQFLFTSSRNNPTLGSMKLAENKIMLHDRGKLSGLVSVPQYGYGIFQAYLVTPVIATCRSNLQDVWQYLEETAKNRRSRRRQTWRLSEEEEETFTCQSPRQRQITFL